MLTPGGASRTPANVASPVSGKLVDALARRDTEPAAVPAHAPRPRAASKTAELCTLIYTRRDVAPRRLSISAVTMPNPAPRGAAIREPTKPAMNSKKTPNCGHEF